MAWLIVLIGLCAPRLSLAQADFRQPLKITANEPTSSQYHLSRSTGGQMVWGPGRTLSLVYWEGMMYASPDYPSKVLLRQWTPANGWATPVHLDDSFSADNRAIGGRHPALAPRPDGNFFAVWHDQRHCTADYSWIDNIELYGAIVPATGTFDGQNIRLTQTASGSDGDNGYMPKLAALPDGRLALAWYDFTWDRSRSEICLKLSDAQGNFSAPEDMESVRMTWPEDRALGDEGVRFTMPSVASDPSGRLHLIWTTGSKNSEAKLYYGLYNPLTKTWLEKKRIIDGSVGGADDPARILIDPASGDVWILYVDHRGTDDDVYLCHRSANASDFDSPILVGGGSGAQHFPDAAIAPNGKLHVVYSDDSSARSPLKLKIYDPSTQASTDQVLPGSFAGPVGHAALLIDPQGHDYIVWEDSGSEQNDLWFTTNFQLNAAQGWPLYE